MKKFTPKVKRINLRLLSKSARRHKDKRGHSEDIEHVHLGLDQAEMIRDFRKSLNMHKCVFATLLGVDTCFIGRLEQGNVILQLPVWRYLLTLMGYGLSEISILETMEWLQSDEKAVLRAYRNVPKSINHKALQIMEALAV